VVGGPLVLLYVVLPKMFTKKRAVPLPGSSVFISGCDSGFGHLSALELAGKGYKVYGTVLSEASGQELVKKFKENNTSKVDGGSITPLICDITNQTHLTETFQRLNNELKDGLHLLVNNAGIAKIGPIELLAFTNTQKVLDVNLIAHMKVMHMAIPLMRKTKAPRIVNVTSLAGKIGGAQMSAYVASKFGLEGVTDCLRRELDHLNFSFSAIEPGFTRTNMVTGGTLEQEEMWNSATEDQLKAYGMFMTGRKERHEKIIQSAIDPKYVVDAIVDALTSETPKTRYVVGREAAVINLLCWILPDVVLDRIMSSLVPLQDQKK